MRALHIVHGSPHDGDVGGTELYVDALARATGDSVLVPGEDLVERDVGYPLWRGGVPAVVEASGADLLHVHHLAKRGIRLPRVPTVVTLHDYNLACLRGQLVDLAGQLCEGPRVIKCSRCVGWFPTHIALRELLVKRLLARSRLISPSADLARRMERLGWAETVHVLDLPLVDPVRPAPEPGEGPVRFLFVGSLIATKGIGILLAAFEGLDAVLDVWGPTPDAGFAERLDLRHHRGVFSAARREEVLHAADVLVVPSTWHENSPLVVREAVAAGLRVVASDVGGIAEIDPDARLVQPGDVAALRGALLAEIATGRGRRPPREYPMEPHLEALRLHYEACC
ncbi:MAG TPA: glycosyltransferase [Myxococcota bacterium]|nr:glycosyltransferase [Myxococcota bacterium]